MSDPALLLSARYSLTLSEAKEGFALATFGKNKFTRYLTPLISLAIVIWGMSMGWQGVGKYYVILGITFLLLQGLLRYWFLPKMFERQYVRHQFGQTVQGIDLYQDYGVLIAADRQQNFHYHDVVKFEHGALSYMLELKDKTVIIIAKQAIVATGKQQLFETAFKRR